MRKSTKLIKKFLALFLVVLMSIDGFAAVVSDNDGAAFITKAEFDSLKNDFVSQLNEYNKNIDNKLSDAIATYLAGVKAGATTTEVSNVSGLSWPVKIINKLKVIETMNDHKTNAEQEPLWNITLDIWGLMERGGWWITNNGAIDSYDRTAFYNLAIDHFLPKHYDKIEYYLNGTRSGDNFIVKDICVKPVLNESTGILHENLPTNLWGGDETMVEANRGVWSVFVMDGWGNSYGATQTAGVWTRGQLRANYSALWSSNNWTWDTSPKLYFDHFADRNTAKSTITTADKYDYYVGTYLHTGQFGNDFGQTLWSGNYEYTSQNLDRIYNFADTTNATHFAPVVYNNILYFTNKKWNRLGPTSARHNWEGRSVKTNTHGVNWLTTPGDNLENEEENRAAGRPWYNKALISTNRLYYNYTLPTGRSLQQRMAYGVPVFYVSKDAKDVKLMIDFSSSSGKSSNKKYIIASTSPITTQKYSDNVTSNTNYIKLKKGTIESRKLELSEGENEIYVGNLDKDKTLYIKILWNDADDEMITLNNPRITWTLR